MRISNSRFKESKVLDLIKIHELEGKPVYLYLKFSSGGQRSFKMPVQIKEVAKMKENPKSNEYIVQFFLLDEKMPFNPDGTPNIISQSKDKDGNILPEMNRIRLDGMIKDRKAKITGHFSLN